MSERLYVLTDLSLAILKELTSKKLWNSGAYPGEVLSRQPTTRWRRGEEAAMENEVVKTKADGSHLPKFLQNLELTKVAKTPRAPKAANGGLGSPTAKVGSAMKKDGGALALTGRKRKASQKKMTAASDEDESDEEGEAAPLPKTPKTSTKSKAGTLTIPKATPKPLAVSPPWKEEAANAADSEAVGKRIRVWWPEDKVYYQGDVTGFNPKKGTHRILYDDGDREELNLAKQPWDFVDDLEQLRDSEEDRARKSGVRALTAPATPGRRGRKSPSKKRSGKKRKASAGEEESEEESEEEKEPPKRKTAPRGKKLRGEMEPPPECEGGRDGGRGGGSEGAG